MFAKIPYTTVLDRIKFVRNVRETTEIKSRFSRELKAWFIEAFSIPPKCLVKRGLLYIIVKILRRCCERYLQYYI